MYNKNSHRLSIMEKNVSKSYLNKKHSFNLLRKSNLLMVKEQMLRVYYDLEASDPELRRLCELACHNPSIDLCHVRDNPASGDISSIFAMIWRFIILVLH